VKTRISAAHVNGAILLLAAFAAICAVWPIWRALFPMEIDTNEAWNAYWADAAAAGRTLYPPPDALVANDYPPLSFQVVAALSSFGMDAVAIGRWLSLLAIAVTAAAVGWCVNSLGGGRMGALVAGLWLIATMVRFFDGYAGMNDPHLTATAMMTLALALFLDARRTGRRCYPAVALMVIAGFYKHTLIATPVAALLWLASHDRGAARRVTLFGAALAAAGLALCVVIYGGDFFNQLLCPRRATLARALRNMGELQWIAPALIIWVFWAWPARRSSAGRFSALYVASALAACFLQKMGIGVALNSQFELVAATAVGLGLAFDCPSQTLFARRFGMAGTRFTILAVLLVRLLLSNRVEPLLVVASADYRKAFHDNAASFAREVERVRATPGVVACSIASVCRRAGAPFVYDAFAVERRLQAGTFNAAELAARTDHITFVAIDARADARALKRGIFAGTQ
jgi:hypothetical protein